MSLTGGSLEATSYKLRRDYAGIQLNGWKVRSALCHVCMRTIFERSRAKVFTLHRRVFEPVKIHASNCKAFFGFKYDCLYRTGIVSITGIGNAFVTQVVRALQLWPLASIVNQSGAIPVKLRALFVNCVAFVWCDFINLLGDWKSFTCPILVEFQWSNRKCAMTRFHVES